MTTFEGHEPHLKLQPSGNQFADHAGAQPAGDAPPADNTTFRTNKRKAAKTTNAFLKKIGD